MLNVLGGLCENYFLLELIFMAFTGFSFWGGCLRVFWYACSNNRCLGASGKGARVDGRCTLCSLSCTCIPGIYIFGFSSVYGFHTLTGLGACVEEFCKKAFCSQISEHLYLKASSSAWMAWARLAAFLLAEVDRPRLRLFLEQVHLLCLVIVRHFGQRFV